MSDLAQLLVPTLRWDPARGYEPARPLIDQALALGVGGFHLVGGETDAVRALTKELQQRSRTPLLFGATLERGAGQQFLGASGLPPMAAIVWLDDREVLRRAARLTAREARTMGVNWSFAPVCDLDSEAGSPLLGARAFGADPARVAELASEWIDACQAEGVLACAKHFPGLGRATADPRLAPATVAADRETLHATDLAPFRAAFESGVASIMTAHVAYPALDPDGAPATLSREILQWLLRRQLKYDGLVVADSLASAGLLAGRDERDVAVRAVRAGCDVLLDPQDVPGVAAALEQARQSRLLDAEQAFQSVRRRLKWAQWASPPNDWRKPSGADAAWGAQLAERVVHPVRGAVHPLRDVVEVVVVDDDGAEGSGDAFLATLRAQGVDARPAEAPSAASRSAVLVALFGAVGPGRGRTGFRDETCAAVDRACAAAARQARDAVVVLFAHPRRATELPAGPAVLCAWSGDRAMQQAAARVLARGR